MADTEIPSDDRIRQEMEAMMKIVDLETMSTKQFIAALSEKFGGVDLSTKKKYIKASITEIIDSMDKDNESEDESSDEDDDEPVPALKKRGTGGGLSAVKEISQELADFLGTGRQMARTEIVKAMCKFSLCRTSFCVCMNEWNISVTHLLKCVIFIVWYAVFIISGVYIKQNNLQNPTDKREILLDEKMKAVFGVDTFTVS